MHRPQDQTDRTLDEAERRKPLGITVDYLVPDAMAAAATTVLVVLTPALD